jgi:hypothetical protein
VETNGSYGGIVGRTFYAVITRQVMGVAIAIVLAVRLIVLVIVGYQSFSVKPSCAVMKWTDAQGFLPRLLNKSGEAESLVATSANHPSSPLQNPRTVSRKRSFHSAQPGAKWPT